MLLKARTNFVVPLKCREDLARTPDLPSCSDLDLTYRRPPCQLKEPADTRALNAVAALSGDTKVSKCKQYSPFHGPLIRYVNLRVAHATGMPGTFPNYRLQRKPPVSHHSMYHGTCVTHVMCYMSGSLTRGGGENVTGIPGACATRNFKYLTSVHFKLIENS